MRRLLPLVLLTAGCQSGGVRSSGPKVLFELQEPRGGVYRIDGTEVRVPGTISLPLCGRPSPFTLEDDRGRKFCGLVTVLASNRGTEMSIVNVSAFGPGTLEQALGTPMSTNIEVAGELVAVWKVGNLDRVRGDTIVARFTTPEGGTIVADRQTHAIPCDLEISRSEQRIEIRTRDNRTAYGVLRVVGRNDWCRISAVNVNSLDARLLAGVVGGSPSIVTYSLGDTRILELALGNRAPND